MDRTARMVNDSLQHAGLIPGDSEVVNHHGGGHSLALNALLNQPGDAERIQVVNAPFITNKLQGLNPMDYRQFTPLVLLLSKRFLFAVRNDFPIKDGKDLIAKFRASVSFSMSSGVETANYAAVIELAKAIGAGEGGPSRWGCSYHNAFQPCTLCSRGTPAGAGVSNRDEIRRGLGNCHYLA